MTDAAIATTDRLERLAAKLGEDLANATARIRVLEDLVRNLAAGEEQRSGKASTRLDRLHHEVRAIAGGIVVTDRLALALTGRVELLEHAVFEAAAEKGEPAKPRRRSKARARAPRAPRRRTSA